MNNLTKEEIQDIEVVYRAFCGDGRVLTILEMNIMKKLKAMVDNYCDHNWNNVCCGCDPNNIYCSTCNINLTTNSL